MTKKEILEGLKLALNRGESLKDAMMSFYNSGYPKKDIEDAARALYREKEAFHPHPEPLNSIEKTPFTEPVVEKKPSIQFKKLNESVKKIEEKTQQVKEPATIVGEIPFEEQKQKQPKFFQESKEKLSTNKVSDYDLKQSDNKLVKIMIALIIAIVFGSAAAFFLFKEQVLNLFSNLFG